MRCVWVILGVTKWDEKRNTELRAMAGLESVEVMLMRRRLRWLGNVAKMEETRIPKCLLACKPDGGKRSVDGQKRRWNDMIVGDLEKCEMYCSWCEQVHDRSMWRGWIKAAAEDVNEKMEIAEQSKKDELKQRREAVNQEQILSDWRCSEKGCHYIGSNKAGLVNHIKQIHIIAAQCRYGCIHGGKLFLKQGLIMHVRFGKENPDRGAALA